MLDLDSTLRPQTVVAFHNSKNSWKVIFNEFVKGVGGKPIPSLVTLIPVNFQSIFHVSIQNALTRGQS